MTDSSNEHLANEPFSNEPVDVAGLPILDSGSFAAGPMAEVREALEGLGYGAEEIRSTLIDLPSDLPIEEMVRRSLQQLGKAGR